VSRIPQGRYDKLEFEGLFLNRRSRRAGACPRRTGLLYVGRQGQAPALQGYDFDENRLFSQHLAGVRKGRPYTDLPIFRRGVPYPLCPFGTFPPDRGHRPLRSPVKLPHKFQFIFPHFRCKTWKTPLDFAVPEEFLCNYLYFLLSSTASSSHLLLYGLEAWPLTQWRLTL